MPDNRGRRGSWNGDVSLSHLIDCLLKLDNSIIGFFELPFYFLNFIIKFFLFLPHNNFQFAILTHNFFIYLLIFISFTPPHGNLFFVLNFVLI